jgi:hypothetical protein
VRSSLGRKKPVFLKRARKKSLTVPLAGRRGHCEPRLSDQDGAREPHVH